MNLGDPTHRRLAGYGALALAALLFGKDFALQLLGLLNAFVPAV
jgi:hypothetical protein